MGQAWCKEKAAKDSKSPLDRVFRCAHRIYPGLKEEGSVLGGATQRVTSSEIGYAGSPPRAQLARGSSLDSTDKPFHPSEWVDVNLEVSNTIDNNYPTTTTTSCPNLMENLTTPIPPPRKRKRNRDRPLPPKPDDVIENHRLIRSLSPNEESKFQTTYLDPEDSGIYMKRKNSKSFEDSQILKESCKHKQVNGTKKIIPSDDVVSEERNFIDNQNSQTSNVGTRTKLEEDEYERFSSRLSIQDFPITNYFNKDPKDSWNVIHNQKRSKNDSTVSLPNYNQLEISGDSDDQNLENEKFKVSSERLLRKSIVGSLPFETIFTHSKTNDEKFEDIVWRADFEGIQINKFENEYDKSRNLNRIHSEDRMDFNDAKNQEREEKSISKTNISSDSGSLNSLETLKDSFISEDLIKASTPIKTVNDTTKSPKKLEISSFSDYTPALDSTARSHGEKNKNVGDDSRNCFFSDTSNLRSQLFYESEETFAGDKDTKQFIQGRKSDSEIGTSGDAVYEEKELALIHRTISEESLPIEMLEAVDSDLDRTDDDHENDFFEEKTAKDVQNKITKNSAGAKEDKEFLKTPPPSPEPKIKADIFENDHSSLLKVLQEEAAVVAGSNLSSMTPSLTELEVALSDMLEKKNEQEGHDDLFSQTDSLKTRKEDLTSISKETKTLEKSIEPCIVPVEKERINSSKDDAKTLQVSQSIQLNNIVPEDDNSFKDKVKIVAVELKDGSIINSKSSEVKKQVLDDSLKKNVKSYNILSYSFDSKDLEVENNHGEETPEKPSRMHRNNVPTPPRRRHRSGSSILKENVCRITKNRNRQDEEPYVNDRLI